MVARRKIVAAIKLNKIQIGPGRSPVGRMAKPGGFTIDKFVRSSAVTQHVPSNEPLSTSRHGNFADVLRHLIAPLHAGTPGNSVCIGVEIAPGNGPGANRSGPGHRRPPLPFTVMFCDLVGSPERAG